MKTRKTNTNTTTTHPPKNTRTAALLAALAALTLAGAATAEARTVKAERVSNSPVTVLSADAIRDQGVTNVGELINQTPNVVTESYGNNPYGTANVNLRGLGTNRSLTLLNGRQVPYGPEGYGGIYQPNLFDIQQVEVLRGPQGTLYGRNANAGAVNIIKRSDDQNGTGYTTDGGYNLNGRYDYSGMKFDPNTFGTTRLDTNLNGGVRYDNGYGSYDTTPTVNTDSVTLNPYVNPDYTYEWTPNDTTLGTTLNNEPVTGVNTDTPTNTTNNTTNDSTPTGKKDPCPDSNTVAETGDSTGVFQTQQPNNDVYDWGGYNTYNTGRGNPCDRYEIDWDRIRQQQAIHTRQDVAAVATGLIRQSQPNPFFDFNYHNTANDELYNRDVIGRQLSQSLTVNHGANAFGHGVSGCIVGQPGIPNGGLPPANGMTYKEPDSPTTGYLVGGGMFDPIEIGDDEAATTTTTSNPPKPELPPIPEYNPTVRPINAKELSDGLLQVEVENGPGLIRHYLDEASELREDAAKYRERAGQWRKDAERARQNAEDAREKAKNAKTKDSREFWENQAKTYDEHADLLEDSAKVLDHSAANNDAAAESYEADAAQSASNYAEALNEQIQRQAQAAVDAANAEAARKAEADRKEAERLQRLQDIMRNSNSGTQSNTGKQNSNAGSGDSRPHGPDMREPRPGKEARNETLRKLLD